MRSPEFWLFRRWPLPVVLSAAVVAFASSLAAAVAGSSALVVVAVGAAVFLLGVVPVRGSGIPAHIGAGARYLWNRRHLRTTRYHPPFNIAQPDLDGGQYGIRWDGDCLLTMLRIDGPAPGVNLLGPGVLTTENAVPLDEIARCLTQFDIGLDAIDVNCVGGRTTVEGGSLAQLYGQVLGPLASPSWLTVWLTLRLNPLTNAEAIAGRGGGEAGMTRTAAIATRRVANRLAARGLEVTVLTAHEIDRAVRHLANGVRGESLVEHWQSAEQEGIHLTTYELNTARLDSAALAEVWTVASVSTTLMLRLRPAPLAGGHEGNFALTALVRFNTQQPLERPPMPGLRPLAGNQYRALVATLPVTSQKFGPPTSVCFGSAQSLAVLAVPSSGVGQLIGADDLGRGVAIPIVGPGLRRVEIIGASLAQQVILRALATGAHVLVHTSRPEAWHSLVSGVAEPASLSLAGAAGTAQITPNVIVYDGVPSTAHTSPATTVHVHPSGTTPRYPDAEVTLTQSEAANIVTIQTPTGSTTVRMIATADEMRYLTSAFTHD
ncbi:type VII secretion protein EccE [Nocardia sp. CA-084685]|uniref:type VII secretion protein EccE n=1 Tax=Nocardia sp. CA-084685 TaxID=3239970 RepID=UPI003D963BC3